MLNNMHLHALKHNYNHVIFAVFFSKIFSHREPLQPLKDQQQRQISQHPLRQPLHQRQPQKQQRHIKRHHSQQAHHLKRRQLQRQQHPMKQRHQRRHPLSRRQRQRLMKQRHRFKRRSWRRRLPHLLLLLRPPQGVRRRLLVFQPLLDPVRTAQVMFKCFIHVIDLKKRTAD